MKLVNISKKLPVNVWGPILTVVATGLYHLMIVFFGWPPAVMLQVPFLIWAGFDGGMKAGLICAAWISAYAFFILPDELWRAVIITAGSFTGAYFLGVKKRELIQTLRQLYESQRQAEEFRQKAEQLDALNSNFTNLKVTHLALDHFLRTNQTISPAERAELEEVQHKIGNILLAVGGWIALDELRKKMEKGKS